MKKRQKTRRPNGTGTLIIGIVLTVLGGGLLVERITGFDVWDYLWRLWPALLIVMGGKMLFDHYACKDTSSTEG
jgi:hypothetical protein